MHDGDGQFRVGLSPRFSSLELKWVIDLELELFSALTCHAFEPIELFLTYLISIP